MCLNVRYKSLRYEFMLQNILQVVHELQQIVIVWIHQLVGVKVSGGLVIIIGVENKRVEVVDIADKRPPILTIFKWVFELEKALDHIKIVSSG